MSRRWVGVGSLLVFALVVGIFVWYWASSAPERRARGILESLLDGDLVGVWDFATEEEASGVDKEAFQRVHAHIVGSLLKGWKREGDVQVSWEAPYGVASVPVRCGDGTKFVAQAFVWTGEGGRLYGSVVHTFVGLLRRYIMARDGLSWREASERFREEFTPLFVKEGITTVYVQEEQQWYRWDGSPARGY